MSPYKAGVASVGREAVGVVHVGCRGHRSKSGDQEGTQRFQSGKVRAGREAGKKHGGQHRDRNGIFVRGVFGVAAIELRSATIVRCACSRSTAPSSRQSGVRMAIVCNVERSAVLRRVEVCCTLPSAIAIVLGVRGLVCDGCVRAGQSVRLLTLHTVLGCRSYCPPMTSKLRKVHAPVL